ncbi:MAG: hypothetical protein L0Z70_01455, partial [Chloroflexi bacterium]|nr:hypothetical protein [Chloroflexota bacterium]
MTTNPRDTTIVQSKRLSFLLVIFSLIFAACQPAAPATPTGTAIDPQAVFTAAASTAQARLTAAAAFTPEPTQTQIPSPTVAVGTVTPTASPSPAVSPIPAGADRVEFVLDVTVPDMTEFDPGEAFTKTWRLLNSGTTTWTKDYRVIFASGSQMGASAEAALPADVPPGQTMDVSIAMTAPATNGVHTSFWLMRNPQNQTFGIGADGAQPFYVQINVIGAGGVAPTATPTGAATGSASVTNVTL